MDTFKVIFSEEKEGVFAISLVENPAIEIDFIALSKANIIKLAEVSEEKRLLISPVLIPNQPIYRRDDKGNEFNIIFPAETILKAQQNFYKQGFQRNSNIEHDDNLTLNDVTFVESWIKEDDTHDKSLKYGFDLPNGTWFAVMKVENDETWQKVKNGEVKGFSIEGNFDFEKINLSNNMSFKEQFREVLVEFGLAKPKEKTTAIELGAIATVDGSLKIEFEGAMLALGAEVWMTDENGEKQPVPDGEYTLENDMIVVIADSKCVEIKDKSNNSNSSDGIQMSKEQNEDFLISLADSTDIPLTPEQITKAIRILIDYNFGWKIREKKENEFFNEIISMAIEELKKDVDDVKLSIAKQISEGFTKLSEAVKEEEKEVEEIKLTKKQNEVSLENLTPLERFRATKFRN